MTTSHRPYVLATELDLRQPTGWRGACACGWESIGTAAKADVAWTFAKAHVSAQSLGVRVFARG